MTCFKTESAREGQTDRQAERASRGVERRAEDRQGKHFGCHCVHGAAEVN